MTSDDVVVIGAGIIGISIALELQSRGRAVRVIDRTGVASEASRGNAGAFAFSDVIPLATPGILRNVPAWLLDPLGPLTIRPSYLPSITPWLLRFWRASWRDRFAASVTAQAHLMALSRAALDRQIAATHGNALIRREGQLQLYDSEASFRASLPAWDLRRRHGIRFTMLDSPAAIADIQPGIHPRFTRGAFTPDWLNTTDPLAWAEHLARRFRQKGGVIHIAPVETLCQTAAGVSLRTPDRDLTARQVVIAAGAWSHHLARMLGDTIPLETERGYNTTLPASTWDLRTHLTFSDHGFVVSRIGKGIRIGGAVEFGGLRMAPNYRRADILRDKALQFLPGLKADGGTRWMGFRPSTPDSLPVIGRATRAPDVFYAFGHGHLGLTQSAGTAELVADLLQGQSPPIPPDRYSPSRF